MTYKSKELPGYKLLSFLLLCGLHHCLGDDHARPNGGVQAHGGSHQDHKHLIYQRHFDDYDWVNSLIWNLIGYSTVLVPAFAIFRMAKFSNFNEREGKI